MSFASLQEVRDPRALRALAHPLRMALLNHLMYFGDRTATECAAAVGSTPSNISYHLRSLGKFGLVEEVESTDGRERRWRSAATGYDFGSDPRSPAERLAGDAVAETELEGDIALARRGLARQPDLPPEWQAATSFHGYGLRITAAELTALVAEVDALIRPFIALTREDAPADAEVAHVRVTAFRHPDVP